MLQIRTRPCPVRTAVLVADQARLGPSSQLFAQYAARLAGETRRHRCSHVRSIIEASSRRCGRAISWLLSLRLIQGRVLHCPRSASEQAASKSRREFTVTMERGASSDSAARTCRSIVFLREGPFQASEIDDQIDVRSFVQIAHSRSLAREDLPIRAFIPRSANARSMAHNRHASDPERHPLLRSVPAVARRT